MRTSSPSIRTVCERLAKLNQLPAHSLAGAAPVTANAATNPITSTRRQSAAPAETCGPHFSELDGKTAFTPACSTRDYCCLARDLPIAAPAGHQPGTYAHSRKQQPCRKPGNRNRSSCGSTPSPGSGLFDAPQGITYRKSQRKPSPRHSTAASPHITGMLQIKGVVTSMVVNICILDTR